MLLSLYDWSWGRARAKAFRGSNLWRCYCLIRRDLVLFTPLALRIARSDRPLFENHPLLLCVLFISNNVSFLFDSVTPFNYGIIHFGSGICLFCFSVSFALFLCRNCDTSVWVCACFLFLLVWLLFFAFRILCSGSPLNVLWLFRILYSGSPLSVLWLFSVHCSSEFLFLMTLWIITVLYRLV